jgi:hypothetical protein
VHEKAEERDVGRQERRRERASTVEGLMRENER